MIDKIIENDLDEIIKNTNNVKTVFKNKTILVTGGAGFLGSWLCDVFFKLNSKVICQDNYSTGSVKNINHLIGSNNFRLIRSDVSKKIVDEKIDFVIHLASRASPENYRLNRIDTLLTNSQGTKNALELAKKNLCVFLFSSTSEIYGDAKIIPTPEEYWGNVNPIGERSCYDEGKRYGEALCMAYKNEHKLDSRIVRIFNTYGPRMRADGTYGRAISKFVSRALTNQELQIFGDGKQTRSFCYITDTIRGILSTLLTKSPYSIINLGNDKEVSIKELADIILKLTASNSKIVYKEKMPDDPRRRRPDITKAKKVLKLVPNVSLSEGLTRTIKWFKENN